MITEKYEPIQSLFNDPEFENSNVYAILEKFKRDGGEVLGEGSFGIVLSRPEWNFVLKIFVKDDSYLRFVRFAIANPRKSYPKFFDIPRRIKTNIMSKPNDKDDTISKISNLYIVKSEKLFPISEDEFLDIQFYLKHSISNSWSSLPPDVMYELKRIDKKYPGMKEFDEDFIYLNRGIIKKKYVDLHSGNIMKRDSGEFVLVDPFYDHYTSSYFQ